MPPVTLLDIAVANGSDAVVGLVDESIKAHPELVLGSARTIKGINYKTLVRTGVPSVDFRNANEGAAIVKGVYENRQVETFIMEPQWEADKAVADRYEDGWEAYLALEAGAVMEGSMQTIGKSFYYGDDAIFGSAKGFPGLLQSYDSTNMVVDAGGTTDDKGSSVWGVKFGPKNVQWVWGNNGELEMSDVQIVRLTDDNGNPYTGYRQGILAYPGLQVANIKTLGRIKKLTVDSGGADEKPLTGKLIYTLLSLFQVGQKPDVLFMSRRSLRQLRDSRTATNPTGTEAPFPKEVEDIPIAVTDSIVDIEKLAL